MPNWKIWARGTSHWGEGISRSYKWWRSSNRVSGSHTWPTEIQWVWIAWTKRPWSRSGSRTKRI